MRKAHEVRQSHQAKKENERQRLARYAVGQCGGPSAKALYRLCSGFAGHVAEWQHLARVVWPYGNMIDKRKGRLLASLALAPWQVFFSLPTPQG